MIYSKNFLPLFLAVLFSAPVFSQGGMLMPSTWPTSQPSAKPEPAWTEPGAQVAWGYLGEASHDTTIDGWQIRYVAEPQGTIGWQWDFGINTGTGTTNYLFDQAGKCVWASFVFPSQQDKRMMSILSVDCLPEPPVPFEKTGLLPKKVDPHTQAIGEMDSTQTDLMALNLFGELVSLTDTVTKLGSLKAGNFLFNHSKLDGSYQMLSQNLAGQWYATSNPDIWHGDLTFVRPNEVVVSWFFEIKNETITLSHVSTKGKGRGSVLPDLIFYLKDLQAITGN